MSQHLVILGASERLWKLAGHFRDSGVPLTLVSGHESGTTRGERATTPGLVLLEASHPGELEELAPWAWSAPWLLLATCPPDGAPDSSLAELMVYAYRTGAQAALPAETPDSLVVSTAERLLATPKTETETAPQPRRRHHPAGAGIPLHRGEVLLVVSGVVAQIAWHHDGTEGLVGLWGSGQLLPGHPEDPCCLALRAHTDVTLEISPLPEDTHPMAPRLLERIRLLEAWSAMQSRPSMEQRLLGILDLLAEQFGRPERNGTVIDVRVTHAQLAAAIGANRATVTRLFGPLRRRGQVETVTGDRGERLFLPGWQQGSGHGHSRHEVATGRISQEEVIRDGLS